MLIRRTEVAQEKNRRSLHHQRRCRSCLDVKHGPEVGKPGAFDWAGEDRWKSVAYVVLRKVRKLEGVRCVCLKACAGLDHRQVWFVGGILLSLATEAGQDRLGAAQTKCRSREAKL